jgi:hypothetical protein
LIHIISHQQFEEKGENRGLEKLGNFPKVMWLVAVRAGFEPQFLPPELLCSTKAKIWLGKRVCFGLLGNQFPEEEESLSLDSGPRRVTAV